MLCTAILAVVHSTAEHYSPVWHHSAHTCLTDTANCGSMPASNLPCFVAMEPHCLYHAVPGWSPAPLSARMSIRCKCMAPQIETPICTHRTTTYQFIWQQQHIYGTMGGSPMECGVGGQPYKTLHFHPWHRHPPPWNDPPKTAGVRLNRLRTNWRLCCPPVSYPMILHNLTVFDNETIEWLLNICPEI